MSAQYAVAVDRLGERFQVMGPFTEDTARAMQETLLARVKSIGQTYIDVGTRAEQDATLYDPEPVFFEFTIDVVELAQSIDGVLDAILEEFT